MAGFAPSFEIAGRQVGAGAACLVIGEAGVAHFGSVEKARVLVDLAKASEADVVKFQHFRTEKLFGPSAAAWRKRMTNRQLSDEEMASVARYCLEKKITFICTAHDEASLDFLDRELDVPAFKIGSGEVENWPFLADIARRGKPIILSTGLYTLDNIRRAVEIVAENGCRKLAILHCVTSYPAEPATINLQAMRQIRTFFSGPVGYSDHTAGTAVPLAAVAMGAEVIEKHIALDFDVPDAQDWKVSCGPADFQKFIADVRAIEAACGGGQKTLSAAEAQSVLWARKSITSACDIPEDAEITGDMLIMQRPGDGLPGSHWNEIVGSVATRAIAAGSKISLEMVRRPSHQRSA